MVVCAAHLEKLTREIERLAAEPLPIAEINRRVGERAWELGLVRPSYARVRQIVVARRTSVRIPSWGELLIDVDTRRRPPDVLLKKLAGTWEMDEDAGINPQAWVKP